MKIVNHILQKEGGEKEVPVFNSPNKGGTITPAYLVIHYTASPGAKSAINWFMNPDAKASAHLVIGMDGTITQMVPFNKCAFHAGVSRWDGIEGLNRHSIGIELDNPGHLRNVGGKWMAWFGTQYPDDKVLIATHKNQHAPAGWHIFPQAQIEATIKVSQLIVNKYQLKDILGHDDIAPGRKEDPGPAFPMESFKSKVLGRSDDSETLYKVNTANTNFRSGPSTSASILGKLSVGTKVKYIKTVSGWHNVLLANHIAGIGEPEGWVHSSLLTKL